MSEKSFLDQFKTELYLAIGEKQISVIPDRNCLDGEAFLVCSYKTYSKIKEQEKRRKNGNSDQERN